MGLVSENKKREQSSARLCPFYYLFKTKKCSIVPLAFVIPFYTLAVFTFIFLLLFCSFQVQRRRI